MEMSLLPFCNNPYLLEHVIFFHFCCSFIRSSEISLHQSELLLKMSSIHLFPCTLLWILMNVKSPFNKSFFIRTMYINLQAMTDVHCSYNKCVTLFIVILFSTQWMKM